MLIMATMIGTASLLENQNYINSVPELTEYLAT